MDTPILLLVWRRPHTLRLLINAIRPLRPTRLYVACDGPSNLRPSEADLVNSTRRLIDEDIDWPCHIERFYSDVNQGCRLGVSRAITWFFQYVDEGIILEDDCVPHPSFFVLVDLIFRMGYGAEMEVIISVVTIIVGVGQVGAAAGNTMILN